MLKHLLKKSIAAATSAAMVAVYFQCMPPIIHSHAEETITGETSDGFAYTIYPETSDVMITSYTGDHETVTSLVLPDKIKGYDVTVLGPWLFQDYPELSSVTLPSGLKKMHKRIFANAPKLKSLTLPKSLGIADSTTEYSIMDGVQGALSLSYIETLNFEDGIEAIPRDICYNAENLKSVVIPDSVKTIGQGAFSGCTSLKSVDIPNSVTLIESFAFDRTSSLESITIPSSVENIAVGVFAESAISSIELSEGLTTIGKEIFSKAENLKEVTVPSTVTEATNTFTGSSVETITFADGMTTIPYKICEDADQLTKINIPRSVTDLGDHSFAKTDGLQEFTLPKQITKADWSFSEGGPGTVHLEEGLITIPEFTFGHATNTKSIDWTDSVTTISKEAFTCAGLETVAIPDTVKYIGQSAFSSCESLTDLTLPTKGCELALWAFSKTKSLKSVYIPDGLFGDNYTYTFESSGLESITFAPTVTVIPEGICAYCENLTEIKWSDATEIIRQRAFDACTALKDAKLPDSITTIEHAAFYGTGLETLHIPESLTTLGDRAFMNTKSLKQLYVPFDIEKSEPAFMGSGIEKLEFADDIKYIRNTYQELPKLTEVIIPESVKTIGAKAFYGDKSLSEIKLPSGLEEIGSQAFMNTEALYSITIPKNVTKTDGAIFTVSRLTEITFEDGMEAIPENICRDAQSLATAHIPASVKKIRGGAFINCRNLTTLDMPQNEISFAPDTFLNCDVLFDERVDIYSRADTLINRIETSQGQNGLNNYTVYYKVNPRFEEKMTEGYIDIWVEDSNPIVCASLIEGLRSSPDAETQTHLVAPFNALDKEGVIRFSTRPKENANTAMTANFKLKMENEFNDNYYEKSIPVSGEKLEKVSLKAPSAVQVKDSTVSFGVYGYAPADTEVVLFVNDNEVAKVFPSKYTGRYTANITAAATDGSEIKVYAMSGDTKSATQVLKCEEDVILVEKVMLYHDTTLTSYGLDITKIFTEGVTPFISYNPRKPIGFEVTLSDNNCMYVAVSSTVNEETSYMELEFDEESGTWKGEGYFATSIPGTLNVHAVSNKPTVNITCEMEDDGNSALYSLGSKLDLSGISSEDSIAQVLIDKTEHSIVAKNDSQVLMKYEFDPEVIGTEKKEGCISYVGVSDSVYIGGKDVQCTEIADNPQKYGFSTSPIQYTDENGVIHTYYIKNLNGLDEVKEIAENTKIPSSPNSQNVNILGPSPKKMTYDEDASLMQNMFDMLADWGDDTKTTDKITQCINGQIVVTKALDGKMNQTDVEAVSTFVVESTKTCITDYAERVGGHLQEANSAYGELTAYADVAVQQLGMFSELRQIANSDNHYVKKHQTAYAVEAAVRSSLQATTTLATSFIVGQTILAVVTGGTSILVGAAVIGLMTGISFLAGKMFGAMRENRKKLYAATWDGNLRYGIDPSGIAYEWLPSNPVEGATAEIYYKDDSGAAVKWNAEDYDQVNPLITDKGGRFAWDVPEGMWQVRVSAEGYEGAESEWLPVLPVQTGVDLKLTSKKPAEIADAGYGGGKVYVKFTRHMLDSSVTDDSLVLKDVGGTIVPCDVAPVKEEGNGTDTSILFALTPKDSVVIATATVSVTSAALSYAKTPCADTAEKALRAMSDDEIPQSAEEDYTLGDVNDDGKVDAKDASMILVEYSKASTGAESGFTESQKLAGEVNGDGKIDAKDASAILAYYAMASTATGDVPTLKEFVNPKSA